MKFLHTSERNFRCFAQKGNLPLCAKVERRLSFENLAKKTFFSKKPLQRSLLT
jgi:hypothetical protein